MPPEPAARMAALRLGRKGRGVGFDFGEERRKLAGIGWNWIYERPENTAVGQLQFCHAADVSQPDWNVRQAGADHRRAGRGPRGGGHREPGRQTNDAGYHGAGAGP